MGRAAVMVWRSHGPMVMTGMGVMLVVRRRPDLRGQVSRMRHHAGHDRRLQPRGAEQGQHVPREDALSSSYPTQAEVHATHLLPTGGEPYPLETTGRKQECRRTHGFAEHTHPLGTMSA